MKCTSIFHTCVLTILFLVSSLSRISAQQGTFVMPYYSVQYTGVNNFRDNWSSTHEYENTYRSAFGLHVFSNISDIFGLETGLRYSLQGQKYSGFIQLDGNLKRDPSINDTVNQNYNSRVNLNYLQIPIMLRLNSRLASEMDEDDKVYLSIGAGVQLEFLMQADMEVNPYPIIDPERVTNVKDFYKNNTVSFIANAMFHIKLFPKVFAVAGSYLSRTMGTIENTSYPHDFSKDPMEYFFPISTKKEAVPQDYSTRRNTYNTVYALLFGLAFQF
jgi:hypothetical protein